MKKVKNVHAGHRERLLRNYLSGGCLTDIQKVEVLLFYCFRQGDTNETAHRLLDKFETIENLLFASEEEIAAVKGMGAASAKRLCEILSTVLTYRQILRERNRRGEWRYSYICAYLSERILPRLLRDDVGCVAVILKDGMHSDSFNLSAPDLHLLESVSNQKQEGELFLICVTSSSEDYLPFTDNEKTEFCKLGVDAIAIIPAIGKIDIELI